MADAATSRPALGAEASLESLPADAAGGGTGESAPQRRCIVTRESRQRSELLRFVVDPDGRVVFDVDGKLPGRGLWVTADRATLARAVKRNAFARAARRKVAVPDDLVDRVGQALTRKTVERLALARRAGLLVAGLDHVHAAIKAGEAVALLVAADAAGRHSADRLARLAAGTAPELPALVFLRAGELGQPLGRSSAHFCVLKRGGATAAFMAQAWQLAQFRRAGDSAWQPAPALARGRAGGASDAEETGSDD